MLNDSVYVIENSKYRYLPLTAALNILQGHGKRFLSSSKTKKPISIKSIDNNLEIAFIQKLHASFVFYHYPHTIKLSMARMNLVL